MAKLHTALHQHRKLTSRPSLMKWEKDIRQFLLTSDVGIDELESVLGWYIQHIGEPYIPQAYSARGFCEKFVRIRDQMQMSGDSSGEFPLAAPAEKIYVQTTMTAEELSQMARDA